jgi:Zn-dependent protease with chaperone function
VPFFEALSPEALRLVPIPLAASAVLAVPLGFVCGLFAGWVTGRSFVTPWPETPWTERARASLGVRTGLRLASPYATMVVGLVVYTFAFFVGDASRLTTSIAAALACYLGVDFVRLRVERDVHRAAIPSRGWWSLKAIWFLLAAPQLVVVVVAGILMPRRFDGEAIAITAIALVLVVAIGTGGLWRILRAVGFIREATPALSAAIDEAQKKTGVVAEGTWILPTFGVPFCNAFALPVLRRIAFTSDAVETLGHDELVAIAAHELGHVAETRTVAWVRTLRGTAFLPLSLARPLEASFGATGILGAIFAMLAVALLFQRLSRAMEVRADKIAHGHGHAHAEDGATYARALEKVYARNLVPAVMPGKRMHPDLYDRMIAAGAPPDYPRPAKPKIRARLLLAAIAAVLVALALVGIGMPVRKYARHRIVDGLSHEADARIAVRDDEGAVRVLVESIGLVHDDPRTWARYVRAVSLTGDCAEARDSLVHARALPGATDPDAAALLTEAAGAVAVCAP